MTDMNRLTNHENSEEKLKDIFSDEIREKLASEDSGKPSLEDFRKAVAKDKKARCKKHTAIAACFAAALLIGYFALDMQVSDVDADKNPKEVIQTEDGVIIEDGGYGSSEEEDNVWVTEDWEHVEDAKTISDKILIPKYIPKHYKFERLTVELMNTGDLRYGYSFIQEKKDVLYIEVYLTANNADSVEIANVDNVLECDKGKVYIQKQKDNTKIATIESDDGLIVIFNKIDDNSLIKIVDNLKY